MEIVELHAKIKRILKIIIYKEQLFAIDSYIIDIVIISLRKMATDHSNLWLYIINTINLLTKNKNIGMYLHFFLITCFGKGFLYLKKCYLSINWSSL